MTLSEILHLPTGDILSAYDPKFQGKDAGTDYLILLVEVWLHDVAFHWKSKTPPFEAELWKTGLGALPEDGDTRNRDANDRPW